MSLRCDITVCYIPSMVWFQLDYSIQGANIIYISDIHDTYRVSM